MNYSLPGANAILNGTILPSTLYLQLHIGDPSNLGTLNVAATNTREAFTRGTSTLGKIANDVSIGWASAVSTQLLTHGSIWGSSVGGLCWFIGKLNAGIPIQAEAGQPITIAIGQLTVVLGVWAG